eukprot:gnl/MRDRNA2_/MRDRNA2_52422_c0_seq1.p1 gnl/MRDRNA2_/MRDRNA2_52422_c0~~gnl/MRDRNA2_/MRDRNA2_52422_c0_seq1.p1  ORF type:complete len:321 (-),score=47.98 gnl/MRDRNA2_/MRDRNA2_52422_c0_seq1:176-1138(-)
MNRVGSSGPWKSSIKECGDGVVSEAGRRKSLPNSKTVNDLAPGVLTNLDSAKYLCFLDERQPETSSPERRRSAESLSPERTKPIIDVDSPSSTGWCTMSRRRRKSAPESTNDRGQVELSDSTLSLPSSCGIHPDGVWDWPLCKRQMRYRVLQLFSRDELASDQLILRERQAGRALQIENAQLQLQVAQAAIEAEDAHAEAEHIRNQVQQLSEEASANARKHLECKAQMEALAIENAMLREQLPHAACCSHSSGSQSHQATVAGRLCQTLIKPRISQLFQSVRNSTRRWNEFQPSLTSDASDPVVSAWLYNAEFEGGALRV